MKGIFDSVIFDKQANSQQEEIRNEFRNYESLVREGFVPMRDFNIEHLYDAEYKETFDKCIDLFSVGVPALHVLEILYAVKGKRIRRECAERTKQLV
jgi:hypothetical protein